MEQKRQQIRDLLVDSLLVRPERREKILANLENYDEKQLDKFIVILQRAKNKEPEIMAKVAKDNPKLVKALHKIEQNAFLKKLHFKEDADRKEELKVLVEIEAELDSI